ncbi:MAG: hypothetical protein WDM76_18830 [Limisphaerales bacterium]
MGSDRGGEDEAVWFHAILSGAGFGRTCIPIDPFYLAWKAKQVGQETRFVNLRANQHCHAATRRRTSN